MERNRKHSQPAVMRYPGRAILSCILCGLLLLSAAASANHALHKKLHASSGAAAHLCLICSFSKGEVGGTSDFTRLLSVILALLFSIPFLRFWFPRPMEHRLAPSRGPPFFLSPSRVAG